MARDAGRKLGKRPQGLAREGLLLGGSVVAGALLLPVLVWVVGGAVLGPYHQGGPLRLLADFARLLVQGSQAAWIILLGPYLLLSLSRITRALWRRSGG